MGLLTARNFWLYLLSQLQDLGLNVGCGPLAQRLAVDQQVHQASERAAKTEILQDLSCQRAGNHQRGVNNRLSRLSSSEAIFNAAAPQYQDALRKADYLQKLLYDPSDKGVRN